ncbi:MAG: BrnA antitoxin family protein [Acidobacteria bacterium]|nr:BrnA antitoxin family protein [Acidobacteriota bacterium]
MSQLDDRAKRRWSFKEAKAFDQKFDEGEVDIIDDLDLSTAKRPNQTQKGVNVDFPVWMIDSLDKEASRMGITRQSIIKVWLAERLEEAAANKALQRTNR